MTHSESGLLEASVARAGMTLACPFSSSDEFEAELIRERRAAGFYGPSRHQLHVVWGGIAAAALLIAFLFG
jgi:hypothetical protein